MKKTLQSNFRRIQTKPAKTHSPDFRAGNSIKPTRSPQNIQYILKQNDRQKTPIKGWQVSKNEPYTQTAQSRYFQNNRNQYKSISVHQSKTEPHTVGGYCHNCCSGNCHCVHAANNQEVVIQLKKIITMINGAAVTPFDPSQSNVKTQLQTLKLQNSRLTELVSRLKSKPSDSKFEQNQYTLESQIKILKQQLTQNTIQYDRQRQQLYRTNKTLSSQVKSLQDRNTKYSKQIQLLTKQLKSKQQSQYLRDSELRKKNATQKLSLSMIKQQYNSSIQTLKSNLQYQVNNQLSDNQSQIKQYKYKLDILQQRLKNCSKVNQLNKTLNQQNKKLIKQLQLKNQNLSQSQQINKLQNQIDILNKQNQQKLSYINLLNKQNIETKNYYQNQIANAKNANNQATQIKVKKLVQIYQQQIKILKKQAKTNICNHQGIEQQNQQLRQQNQQNWQQVIKLRNQLVKYTSQNTRLQHDNNQLRKQNNQLKHQINNDNLNLLAKTTLLENQNNKLKKQLQINNQQNLKNLANYQDQNNYLRDQNYKLRNQIQGIISQTQKPNTNTNTLQLQNRINQLQKDLQRNQQKCQNFIQQNNRLYNQIQKIKQNYDRRQYQIKQNLKKQLQDNKINYQDQIHKINQQIYTISNQYQNLKIKYQNIQKQISNTNINTNIQQNQLKQKDQKIYQLQLTIRNLGKIIQQTQLKMGKLQDNLKNKYKQNQNLHKQITSITQDYQQNIRINNNKWQNQLNQLRFNADNQINRLNKLLAQKQNQEEQIITKFKSKISHFQSQSLKKQLEDLKKLIDQGQFGRISEQLSKIVENYERQLIRSQQKTMEIDSLTKDKVALQQKISDLERLRLMLDEKINILEGNIKIVENQLKQRKSLCDSLLNQKILLQKENLMLKKIKLDKQSIEQTKNKARQISLKIDRLLAMEQQRQQNLTQMSRVQSESVVESIIRKL